jgi:hypothetical protein
MAKEKTPIDVPLPKELQFALDGKQVVAIRLSSYKSNGARAAMLVFADGNHKAISVNVEKHASLLEGDEFYLANYGETSAIAEILLKAKIVKVTSNIFPKVVAGSTSRVPIVKIAESVSGA